MRTPRLTLRQAVKLCQQSGVRVGRKWDGHYLFYLPGQPIVSVNPGRGKEVVPPQIMRYLRRNGGL